MQWDNLKDKKEFWDDQIPEKNHQERFEQKLNEHFPKKSNGTFQWLRIAAVLLIAFVSIWFLMQPKEVEQVAVESNENQLPIEDAEYYYKMAIDKQFQMLAAFDDSPDYQNMISDSKALIKKLEEDYITLEKELELTADYRVAAAMISNYQNRIKILEELIQNIQYVNHLKEENHENLSI